MTPLLSASMLRHAYRGSLSLEVDHLEVEEGQVLCLLGSSGAGKSTLLRLLAALEKPHSGEIRVAGQVVTHRTRGATRRISGALQEAYLWRGTVKDNVEFGLKSRNVGARSRRVALQQALELVGLTGFEKRRVQELSGGQAQRVSLARALAVSPEILFLDEPLAHIDEPLRENLALELRRFVLRTGCACIWVTHDRAEALAVSDQVGVIDHGRLLQSGSAQEVFTQPADEAVARMVGAENVLEGTVVSNDGGLAQVELAGGRIEVHTELPVDSRVICLIRPEDIGVWDSEPSGASPRNRFKARLERPIALGVLTKLVFDQPLPLTSLVTRPTYEDLRLEPGDEAWIGFKTTAAHVIRRS